MHIVCMYLSLQGLMALIKFILRFKFKHVLECSARLEGQKQRGCNLIEIA